MSNPNIGKLVPPDAKRDAIHVAVAPVIAASTLHPGQWVRIDEEVFDDTGEEDVSREWIEYVIPVGVRGAMDGILEALSDCHRSDCCG